MQNIQIVWDLVAWIDLATRSLWKKVKTGKNWDRLTVGMEKRYKSRRERERERVVCGRWTSWGITAGIPLSPPSMKLACATPPLQISLVYERSRGSRTTWKGKQPSIGIHGVHTGRAWRECEYWYRDNERGTPRVSESTSHPSRPRYPPTRVRYIGDLSVINASC